MKIQWFFSKYIQKTFIKLRVKRKGENCIDDVMISVFKPKTMKLVFLPWSDPSDVGKTALNSFPSPPLILTHLQQERINNLHQNTTLCSEWLLIFNAKWAFFFQLYYHCENKFFFFWYIAIHPPDDH